MAKKKGSTDDFDSILGDIKPEGQAMQPVIQDTSPAKEAGKVSGNDAQTTLYYPKARKRRLKEQALHEDTTVNALVLEAVRLLFEKRGITLD
jgi:hypothetical protein